MGDAFRRGLLQTARLGTVLDLTGKLGGDRPTSVAAVAQLMRVTTSINLSQNTLTDDEGSVIADALRLSMSLQQLDLSAGDDKVGEDNGDHMLADACQLGDATFTALAEALKVNNTLTSLKLRGKRERVHLGRPALDYGFSLNWCSGLGDPNIAALAEALCINNTLTSLDLSNNGLSSNSVKLLIANASTKITLQFGNNSESLACNWCSRSYCLSQRVVTDCERPMYTDGDYDDYDDIDTIKCSECNSVLYFDERKSF
jgi:hypothetical protein